MEEEKFPIAYIILMCKEVEQMEKLLMAIYRPQNIYLFHFDLSSSVEVHSAVHAITGCFDNVFVVSEKETIVYAGFKRLQADINCMADLLQKNWEWKYFINLLSQQYPIKTSLEIVKLLQISNIANDIEGITSNRMLSNRLKYINKYIPQDGGKATMYRTNVTKSNPPHNLTIVKGSAYVIFSRNFVRFIIYDEKARDFLEWCKEVCSPEEYYWAMLNHNPHLGVSGSYKEPECNGEEIRGYVIKICSSSEKTQYNRIGTNQCRKRFAALILEQHTCFLCKQSTRLVREGFAMIVPAQHWFETFIQQETLESTVE
ncbi:hypothetical protein CHS0354_039221 [Potamilus streckersoni]|uniref:Beta-1,6-N-acetylglucosaminyltransferase n=1 Tax=Potamilus streckersoni TaxID=2493646 RepID=A0AAE0WBL0_9BIVA|nr:hypothetical protein CHS0354_039221 [Potamilus streckersoni]